MNELHERVRSYIYKITKGLVSLKEEHTEEIERLVRMPRAYAVLYKWDAQIGVYTKTYTQTITDAEVYRLLEKFINKKPVTNFAKWQVYNSNGELVTTIFTTSICLNYLLL